VTGSSQTDSGGSQAPAPATRRRLRSVVIILIACFCGWLVMELEILGARVLTPYFGSAIFVVMGSVIGVFLLSLAVGYMLGGWISGSPHSKLALGMGLSAAGVWLCLVPFAFEPVCELILDLGFEEKGGSLIAAIVLFGLPTALLGMVSPTAVRWLTTQSGESGLKAGLVLGFSTVASFAGCVVTAFYLVLLSVRRTFMFSGALLFALGAIIIIHWLLCLPGTDDHGTSDRGSERDAQ